MIMQDIAQLIDDCMQSDPRSRPAAFTVFHRIAGSADASHPIKPLATRSAASSFESGRLETASTPSVRSGPDVDAVNDITAQMTSTDADSETNLNGDVVAQPDDEARPSVQADASPEVDFGLAAGEAGLSLGQDDSLHASS